MIEFAQSRGWVITKDGRITFPQQKKAAGSDEDGSNKLSMAAIENTLGYARELETIV